MSKQRPSRAAKVLILKCRPTSSRAEPAAFSPTVAS